MSPARRTAPLAPAAPPRIGSLPTLAVILSVVGAALGALVLLIHHRIAASQGTYTSFCDLSQRVSCDVVLGSSYATLLGIPVAGWGMGAYLVAGATALALARTRGDARLRVAVMLAGTSAVMLGISIYFLFIAAVVIGVFCPLCLSLDAVSIALFATAVAIVRSLRATAPKGWPPSRVFLGSAIATAAAIAVVATVQAPRGAASGDVTVDEIRDRDPRFYAYYISQPVVEGIRGEGGYPTGSASDPVTIVEFTDFECPYCARAYQDLKRALSADHAGVNVVVRNFPLNSDCNPQVRSQVHTHACQAAAAGECAGAQGKFREYEALLFEHQDALDAPSLIGYAARLGLDQTEFERCLGSPAATAAVAEDVAAGAAAGVTSTPTFFINGRRIAGGFQRPEHYRYAVAIERDLAARANAKNPPAS
jgi:protein-disulfide isomerase/uncharacterized membrane protein